MQAIGDHIVVTLIEEDKFITTESGVVFEKPDASLDKPNRGLVVALGEGRLLANGTLRPVPLVVGDKVLFSKYAGADFKLDNVLYLVLSTDDVLVKL
jgi:chaperonin GroES